MATLSDVQIERFATLGSTNPAGAAAALAASVTGPGTGSDVLKVAYDFGSTTAAVGGNTPYGQITGTPTTVTDPKTGVTTTTTMISDGRGGSFPQVTTGATSAATSATAATQDAWAILSGSIGSWFGGDPVLSQQASDFIKQEMQNNIGPNQALVDMRQQQFYKTRFAGNTTRVANGLNALSEADYVGLENTYTDYFTAYGQQALATKPQLATFIGNAVSPTEVKDRLDMAVVQVQQADPTVKAALKQFYPNITDANLVSYFLAPEDTLPVLQRQVQAADIGAAALQQGLSTSKIAAEGLAAYGTTYGQAQTGYGKIAEELPASQKLSQIYNAQTGINYNQAEAEQQYLMNSGAAALEQQKLKDLETQQFQGRSGIIGANVASGYSGSLGKSIQGSF